MVFILGAGVLAHSLAPLIAAPKFIVKNDSSNTVEVTAHWRQNTKELGILSAGAELEFEIDDEAAMTFKATYPDGLVVSSLPEVYFTTGTITRAVVTDTSIEVSRVY